jgi:hypothetical protein
VLPRKQSPAAAVTARAKVAVPKAAEMTAEMAAEMAAAAAKEMELVGVVATAGEEMEVATIVLVVARVAVATAVEEMEAVERTDRVTAMDGGKRKPARGVRE